VERYVGWVVTTDNFAKLSVVNLTLLRGSDYTFAKLFVVNFKTSSPSVYHIELRQITTSALLPV